MICQKCRDQIHSGEACIPEKINGSEHWWFFHPGCYAERKAEQERANTRLQHVIDMARRVH